MNFLSIFLSSTLLLFLSGCFKTAEQVAREKKMEQMSTQLSQSQNIVADLTVMLKSLQSQIDQLNGKLEVLEHQQSKIKPEDISKTQQDIAAVNEQNKLIQEEQTLLKTELAQQKDFLQKVTDQLAKFSASPKGSAKSGQGETDKNAEKDSPKSLLAKAQKLVGQKKTKAARDILEGLMEQENLDPGIKNKTLFQLGSLEYGEKQYDKSLVYFSKIYTKYPKSSLAPGALWYIAQALEKTQKKEEAQAAFKQLKEQYPDSSEAKKVK
jgi:TolA-binding protein